MISDSRLAQLALASYSQPATIETADIHAVITQEDGYVVIALRGTNPAHLVDLLRDVGADETRHDPILGATPETFLADAEQLAWRLDKYLHDPWIGTAHSKGAGEIQDLAAVLTYMGRPPTRLVTFAAPQVGKLNGLIATVPGRDYAMQHDLVPDVPPNRGIPRSWTQIPWIGPVPLDRLECHSMALYAERVAAVEPALDAALA